LATFGLAQGRSYRTAFDLLERINRGFERPFPPCGESQDDKILQAALPVSPALTLPVSLHGRRVSLPVLLGIVGMTGPPFLLTISTDLVILGIGEKLAAVILPPALPLAIGATADKLVGMITGKLKESLAVAAVSIAHQAAPNRDASR
jgi:hypothetical protein